MSTDLERVRKWRKKGLENGRKYISFMLTTKATVRLNEIQQETGDSIAKIIEGLLGEPVEAPISPVVDLDMVAQVKSAPISENEQLKDLIKQLKVDHNLSHREIAEYLNLKGIETISGHGQWQQGSVGKLLKKWAIP
ncbi:MAG: hypothetical protein HN416_12730 [Nitrospina sp.]|jgi:hypothetical protein|nr:hypothetical protein [Nitrospina sp.]